MHIKKLIGDRIYLSPVESTDEDAKKFAEWMSDFNVTDYVTNSSRVLNYKQEKMLLESLELNKDKYFFCIRELETDKLIGSIDLKNISWTSRSAELGVAIGDKEYRSKGYGTEAIKLLLDYGFRYINLHSIRLSLVSVNAKAHKCYLKCGFKDTGCSREQIYINGKYYDAIQMDILENEFVGSYIRNKNL